MFRYDHTTPRVWQICLASLVASATLYAQESSPNKNANPRVTVTPRRVHRQTQRQIVPQSPAATQAPRSTANARLSYVDALRRYQHQRHSRAWWHQHFVTIVLVGGGYYYWEAGFWFPAWGYDPRYQYYDYDGPIYTYGNLLPDQVILNVQRALQELGYYSGALTGALESSTRAAIAAFQRDNELAVTAVVDGPTVQALGLE